MMRILCWMNVELKSSFFFSYGHDSKVLEVIHNLRSIIDNIILRTPLNAF